MSSAFESYKIDSEELINKFDEITHVIPIGIARLAASGIFVQCISRFEVYFEDVFSEYCRTKIDQITNRQYATMFSYMMKKSAFEKLVCIGDEREFITTIESEVKKNKEWLKIQNSSAIDSKRLIGKKDYPKPEHIKLALFKLGIDKNVTRNLSVGLSAKFEDELNRILQIRNTIAHDGIPSEWQLEDSKRELSKISIIAFNLENHMFGTTT